MQPNGFLRLCAFGLTMLGGTVLAAPPEPRNKLVLQAPPAVAVNSVTVSPNGSLVATASGEGGVRLYEARTGEFLRALGDVGDRAVAFSPDGKTITAAGFHMDKLVGVFDVKTGKRVQALAGQTEWEADATAFSPDGKLLASTGTDKQILVWDLATGKLRHQLKDQAFRISAIKFSPDGLTLATGGGDKQIRLWDVATGKPKRTLDGHRDWIATLAFSPDGKAIASGSCDWGFHRGHDWVRPSGSGAEQCEWRLWDVASGKLQRTVAEQGRLLSVAFSPDGKSLACGIDKAVRIYDLSRNSEGRIVTSHDATVTSVAFTSDGTSLISGSHDQTAKRTSLATDKLEWQAPGYFEQVNSVALSADAALLVTGSSDHRFARARLQAGARELGPGAVRLWDARTGRMLRRLGGTEDQIMAVAISPNGRLVAGAGGIAGAKGVVHVWNAETGDEIGLQGNQASEVLAVAFAPDGSLLASGTAEGLVNLLDVRTGSLKRTLANHQGGATAITFSPDGKSVICGQGHGGARVWDTQTGRLLQTCQMDESRAKAFTIDRLINSIGLSRDGTALATCNSSINNEFVEAVRIWDPRTGALVRDFSAENIHGRPMALSPDGTILATGGKSVQLWDVRTGKKLRQLFGHLKRTQSIVFSADGRLIVAGGSYGTTNLWEVATGRHMVTLFAFQENQNGKIADDWLAYHPEGYYDGSPGVEKYLAWRVGEELLTPQALKLYKPDAIRAALMLQASSAE